jgi:hypothetical protein
MVRSPASLVLQVVAAVQTAETRRTDVNAVDMPRGTAVWGYKTVRSRTGRSDVTAIGARSYLYFDGGFVGDDEQVIDFASVTKLPTPSGGLIWLQEPGGQTLTDAQVDEILASGAQHG